jgi:hypothetical protein
MRLDSRRTDKAWFFVDPAGSSGLRRLSGSTPMSRVRYLAPGQVLQRIEQRLVELDGAADTEAESGELPAVEQRLVLRRLHGLYASESEPRSRRAAREEVEQPIRVLLGLEAIARALAMHAASLAAASAAGTISVQRAVSTPGAPAESMDAAAVAASATGASATGPSASSSPSRTPGAAAEQGMSAGPGTFAVWRIADRSRTGLRLLAPDFSPARIGQLVGLDLDGGWQVGVVRRMVRLESEEITYGVEILSRRAVAVEVRAAESDAGTGGPAVSMAVYLPASSENRDPALKSILVPDSLARPGALIGLEHADTRYLVRLGQLLEGYGPWALAAIESAREA